MHHSEAIEKSTSKPKSPPSEPPNNQKNLVPKEAPKISEREQNYNKFLARKPLKNGPVPSGQAFFSEFTKIVKSPKFEVLKTDFADALQFFDFMTKMKILIVYCRQMKRLSMFKEQNESSLFGNQKIVNLINKYCAFTGLDELTSAFPLELKKLNIGPIDLPCLLIFQIDSSDRPTLLHKLKLKEVGTFVDELALILELEHVVGRLFGLKVTKSLDDKKSKLPKLGTRRGAGEEPETEEFKELPKQGPFVARNVRQADLIRRLEEPTQKPTGLGKRDDRPISRLLDNATKVSHPENLNTEELTRGNRYKPKPVREVESDQKRMSPTIPEPPVKYSDPNDVRLHQDRK